MECSCEDVALAHEHVESTTASQDFHVRCEICKLRRADKYHLQRLAAELAFVDEAIQLASVGITFDRHVEQAETRLRRILDALGKQDRPGTSAEDRHAFMRCVLDCGSKAGI